MNEADDVGGALLKRVTFVSGLYAALGGLLSFVGWAGNMPRLTAWDGSGISIQPNTTVAAMASGIALVLLAYDRHRLAAAAGVLAGLLGLTTIFQHVTGIDLGIDTLFMFGHQFGQQGVLAPGRMGPPGSVSWSLIGTALILLRFGARARRVASRLALLTMIIAALSIIGYLFGADRLYSLPRLTIIAFQTSTMIFAAALGILAAIPEYQPTRGLVQQGAAADLRRMVLPAVITIPVVVGFLRLVGENARLYDTAMGTALLVLVLVTLLCLVLWRGADAVERYERQVEVSTREADRATAELREGDRRKDEFLAMLAHELRNPLAAIRNAARVLAMVGPTEARLGQVRDIIERQTGQLAHLVDDLLDVSRITRGQIALRREPVVLQAVLNVADEVVRPLIDQLGHRLEVSRPNDPIRLEGDFVRLVQVVTNLLTNAAKFTPRNGTITLTTEQIGETATIRVRDTGAGIAADKRDRIFELFFQEERGLARTRGGLGLGLTLVRRLVELHGGSIIANSDGEGRGSEFVVCLPAYPVQAELRIPASPTPPTGGGRRLRVLLVEDNPDAAESFALLLEFGGHEVAVAHDGYRALEVVESFAPEIAFVDIGLPEIDGYELASRLHLQPNCHETVFVALTGYGSETDKTRAAEAGFDYHLTKPADAGAIDRVLARVSGASAFTPVSAGLVR